MPSPSKTTKPAPAKSVADWPSLVESGAGLSEAELSADDRMSAPIEKSQPQPFSMAAEFKKHPLLYLGLGALAVGGVAAFLGRGAVARAARPMVVATVRPILVRAAARRPLQAAKLAARYPRAAARVAAGLR